MSTKLKAGTSTSGAVIDADTTGILELQSGSTPTTALTINTLQNIGIGTTNPTFKADIQSTSGALANFQLTSGTNAYVYLQDTARSYSMFSNNGSWGVYDNTGTATRLTIQSNGDVAIGNGGGKNAGIAITGNSKTAQYIETTTSSDVFYVLANTSGSAGTAAYIMPIRTGSTQTFQGGIQWNGSVIAYNATSDYRLKEDIAPMVNALDSILKLKPVTYTWKSNKKSDNGFIAHEIQEIIPNAVSGEKDAKFADGSINPQCVDYSKVVATLTAAIQEQQAFITKLQADVVALKAKVGI
jgi:hypothetical protein